MNKDEKEDLRTDVLTYIMTRKYRPAHAIKELYEVPVKDIYKHFKELYPKLTMKTLQAQLDWMYKKKLIMPMGNNNYRPNEGVVALQAIRKLMK